MSNSNIIFKQNIPSEIYTGIWHGGHIQGIAVDWKKRYIYCSFTTELVKLDLDGNFIGSIKGFTGHLGCLAFCEEDGRVYGSLEYKNDAIGKSILKNLGMGSVKDAFYVAIFDGEKITERDMDAETCGAMTTVWLKEVVEDYQAQWEEDGKLIEHRYGCSGIDGMTFAPAFDGNGWQLLVAYGIYSDVNRTDNDDQVLLSYRLETLKPYEAVLTKENVHNSGPGQCDARYFVHTGNTNWGVQNMEYDSFTGDIFLAVYKGRKEQYPNFPMYVIDGSKGPTLREDGKMELHLKETGLFEKEIWGLRFRWGSTGMVSIGDGTFYFSNEKDQQSNHESNIYRYRYTGDATEPFVLI